MMSGYVWTWTETPTDADIVSGILSGLWPD